MNNVEENIDYRFVVPDDEGIGINIEIMKGKYENIVYRYGKVSIDESDSGEEAFLSFEYNIIKENDSLDDGFKDFIGDILTNIIMKNVNKNKEGDVIIS